MIIEDKCVDDQLSHEAAGPECTSSEDGYFDDQDAGLVDQGYVDSECEIVGDHHADVAEGAKDVNCRSIIFPQRGRGC